MFAPAEVNFLAVNVSGFELIKIGGSFTRLGHQSDWSNTEPKIILTTEDILASDNQEKLSNRGKELGVEAWVPKGAKSDAFVIIHGVIKRVLKKRK